MVNKNISYYKKSGDNGFEKDLSIGRNAEIAVANLINRIPGCYVLSNNNTKEYDLCYQCEGKPEKKLEVKKSNTTKYTGKVVVEYEYLGRPSGIQTTTADFWCFVVESEAYFISKSKLLELFYESAHNVQTHNSKICYIYLHKILQNGVKYPLFP